MSKIKADKRFFCFVLITGFLILSYNSLSGEMKEHGRLHVSDKNPHYLEYTDGTPFFWLGDTGWELFLRLNREDAAWYIDKRKEQCFNVIQCVLISEFEGIKIPNQYGSYPFIDGNTERPAITQGKNVADKKEYDYWDHVDYVVNYAEKQGMYLAILPCWGEYVIPREGRLLFRTKQQAYDYGWFLGNRYKKNMNIIWMLGGDRHPDERMDGVDMWRAMAKGIADGTNGQKDSDGKTDYSTTLMTHHSFNSSSKWFHSDDWIDFDTWGSYHSDYYIAGSYQKAISDWNLLHPRPTLNSEAAYEMHPVNWLQGNGYFTAYDIRDIAYWSVFAGACGHTYGNNCVWQFYDQKRKPLMVATVNWKTAVSSEGAEQMKYLRRLMESRPVNELIPDNSMIVGKITEDANHIQTIHSKNYAYIYIPTGYGPKIKLGILTGTTLKASWFNPRNGDITSISEFENKGEKSFEVPGISKESDWLRTGRGCDWVLILEDSTAKF
jgi:hypothetical protein